MLLRSRVSRESRASCPDCLGQASVSSDQPVAKSSRGVSLIGVLLRAAENGLVPDALIRFGIRRLLRNRRQQLERRSGEFWR